MKTAMLPHIKVEFPELYTKKGTFRKRSPRRYECPCGNLDLKKTKTRLSSMVFTSQTCRNCSERVKETEIYHIWERMKRNQIEQEDFILQTVHEHKHIVKKELEELLYEKFRRDTNVLRAINPLGFLVYYNYLRVDALLREEHGVIEYSINPNKELSKRYERIV